MHTEAQDTTSKTPSMYYLELTARGGDVQVIVNKLKLGRVKGGSGGTLSKPINTYLVGENNNVKIRAQSAELDSGKMSTVSDLYVEGSIKRYGPDEVVSPEGGEVVKQFNIDEVIEKRKNNQEGQETGSEVPFPIEHSISFDSGGASFRDLLKEGPVIEDKNRLLTYAEKLRTLLEKRDVEALVQEFTPKFNDYRAAYQKIHPEKTKNLKQGFRTYLQEQFFNLEPITNFDRDDIQLRSWCNGRVWELYRAPEEPFFKAEGKNSVLGIPVFVGEIDGELKVVR